MNRLVSKWMPNIYFKVTIDKNCNILKTSIFEVLKIRLQVSFWGAPTQAGITEF